MADHKSRGDRDHEHNSEEENNTQMTDEGMCVCKICEVKSVKRAQEIAN